MKREEWRNIFAENLKSILDEKGMSRKELAEDSGVSSTAISEYISGRQTPNIMAVVNIAYALDMEVSDLVDFDERIDY